MVELVMDWLDAVREREGTEKWLELVETLRSVTEGKVREALVQCTFDILTCYLDLLGDTSGARYTSTSTIP